jgi:hypothetical protein
MDPHACMKKYGKINLFDADNHQHKIFLPVLDLAGNHRKKHDVWICHHRHPLAS